MILDVFTPYTEVKPDDYNIWVTIGWFALTAFGLAVVGFIISKYDAHAGPFAIVMGSLVVSAVGLFLGIMSIVNTSPSNNVDIAGIKSWAEETYLVTLNDNEANRLVDGYFDYNDDNNDKDVIDALGTYYGDKVLIRLVKTGDEWLLFSDGKELPKTVK